ncbi:hypothetical protein Tco_0193843 [Tanacetum coccineum]
MRRVQNFHPIESEGDKIVHELITGCSKRDAEVELDHEDSKKQKTNKASGSVQEHPDEEEKELPQEDLQQMMMVVPVEEVYKFDRDDLVKLCYLAKERFSTTEPTDDKEKELWVELKRLFEPDSDDTLWKLQRERLSIVKRSSDVDVGQLLLETVRIKSLLEVTAVKLVLLVQKLLLLVLKVNAAGIKVTTAERIKTA